MYDTGDLARYRSDGAIEFGGRMDSQIKIRGFRIEPGEIEAAIRTLPSVRDVRVLVHDDVAEKKQLVAYVVPDLRHLQISPEEGENENTEQWLDLYEELYNGPPAHEDEDFNIVGWNSTYTGRPIPEEEMREQVEHTAARLLAFKPQSVLEIGCGTGLLLFRIAPHCRRYLATDFSAAVLERLSFQLASRQLAHVELLQRLADDLS